MKFGGIGVPELIIILIVVLLIFGPKNLPKLGSALGKTVKNLREGMDQGGDLEEAADGELEVVEEGAEEPAAEKPVKKSTSGQGATKKKRPASDGSEAPKRRPKKLADEDEDLLGSEE